MGKLGRSFNLVLVGSAIVVGWWSYGWQGLVLAISVIAFWLLLQFSRATRLLKQAAQRPVGHLETSVVMLQSQLSTGMTMAEVLTLTGSLGKKLGQRDDWQWTDAGGDDLVVSLRRGVVVRWAVARADEPGQVSTQAVAVDTTRQPAESAAERQFPVESR